MYSTQRMHIYGQTLYMYIVKLNIYIYTHIKCMYIYMFNLYNNIMKKQVLNSISFYIWENGKKVKEFDQSER